MNRQQDEEKKEEERKKRAEELIFSSIGIQLAVTIAGGALIGIWLDRKYGTFPVFTLILTFLGMAAVFWNIYRLVVKQNKDK